MSHDLQTLQALDSFFTRILAKFVIPHSSPVSVLDQFSSTAQPAARLEMVEIPNRPHAELYDDEKPAKSVDSKRIFSFFAYGAFTLVSALVLGQLGAQGLHQIWKRSTIL